MTIAWHCEMHHDRAPVVAVNFYAGQYQNDWYDWGIRGTLIWPTTYWRI